MSDVRSLSARHQSRLHHHQPGLLLVPGVGHRHPTRDVSLEQRSLGVMTSVRPCRVRRHAAAVVLVIFTRGKVEIEDHIILHVPDVEFRVRNEI